MNVPNEIDPVKAAKAGQSYQGSFVFTEFTRMQDLVQPNSSINYHWSFAVTDKGQVQAMLKLQGCLFMPCQRCQQPVQMFLNEERIMQLVSTEQEAEQLPLTIEPLFVNAQGQCEAYEIIEDELILALPMIPMHGKKDCSSDKNEAYYAAEDEKSTYKPFAQLGKIFDLKE